jgi:hypothetical protein
MDTSYYRAVRCGEAGEGAAVANAHSYTNSGWDQHSPEGAWNGLLFVALDLAHQLETEADRALAAVALSARGFAALSEIAREAPGTQSNLAALRKARSALTTNTAMSVLLCCGKLPRSG